MNKIMSLREMVALVPDGASLALGGSFLHRGPFALVRELIRQGKKDLEIVKQSPGSPTRPRRSHRGPSPTPTC